MRLLVGKAPVLAVLARAMLRYALAARDSARTLDTVPPNLADGQGYRRGLQPMPN
jgi:hypothetical protein